MMMYSRHPYDPYIPEDAVKLVIGSIPPYRFCTEPQKLFAEDVNFYYGSRSNYFWSLMAEITGVPLARENTEAAVDQRKAVLAKLHTGVTDVIAQCIHQDGKSDDASLKDITRKPLGELLLQYPRIDTLLYTSSFIIGQVNQLADQHYHRWQVPRKTGTVRINGREYKVIVLYSPSPLARRQVSKEAQLAQYRAAFGE